MEERLGWAGAAFARVLAPVVRLALGLGLKHAHIEELLRDQLVAQARRLWREQGVAEPNVSQLSVTTGLNRKDLSVRVRERPQALPRTEQSAASKTFTHWLQLCAQDETRQRLPLQGGALSFEEVARQATRGDVHHRTVLEELVRLGLCLRTDDHVELLAEAFVPTADLQGNLAFLADNLRDHANAAVSNVLGDGPLLLERAVFADGIAEADCDAVHQRVQERWSVLHRELVQQLSEAVDARDGAGERRLRVGIYVFHEPTEDPGPAP